MCVFLWNGRTHIDDTYTHCVYVEWEYTRRRRARARSLSFPIDIHSSSSLLFHTLRSRPVDSSSVVDV